MWLAKIAPPAGPEFDQPHRKADRGLDRRQPAARQHQEQRAAEPLAPQQRLEAGEIAPDHRLHIGVGAGGREALVFAHLGRHLGRQRDGDAGQPCREDVAGALLVRRVGEAVQIADRDALDAGGGEPVGEALDRGLVERDHGAAARVDPLRHDKAQPARHQGRRQVDIDVVLLEAVLVADLDRVAEAFGRDQRGPGALALDDRVGRERRAVDDDRQVARREPRLPQHRADRGDDGALRRLRRGQHLGAVPPPARFQRDIGKGAADIDPEPRLRLACRRTPSPSGRKAAECSGGDKCRIRRRRPRCQTRRSANTKSPNRAAIAHGGTANSPPSRGKDW